MINEHDLIALNDDVPQFGLQRGDIGTAVYCYPHGDAFEVEFVTADGRAVATLTLKSDQVRALAHDEILHARTLTAA